MLLSLNKSFLLPPRELMIEILLNKLISFMIYVNINTLEVMPYYFQCIYAKKVDRH